MSTPFPSNKPVINVCVTGAAGQIGYSLVPMIANGLMLGPNQRVGLYLLDLPHADKALAALAMELADCNFALLDKVVCSVAADECFPFSDIVVMCGAFPRKDGMERKDLLLKNAEIFFEQGKLLKQFAPKHARVLVVGNPANTNALLLSHEAWDAASKTGLHPTQITALTRLDHNRAASEAKRYLNLKSDEHVTNLTIWGNHSSTQVPDAFSTAVVSTIDVNTGKINVTNEKLIPCRCKDEEAQAYFGMGFFPFVQQRGAAVIKARGNSSAASAAKSICDHVHDWICGTQDGVTVSMAVFSTGNSYKVADDIIFSFPCVCKNGDWKIQDGIEWNEIVKSKIAVTEKELLEEKALALSSTHHQNEDAA